MSSSKQPTQTSQTVTQTNLPAYMEPFVTRLAGRAEEASNRPYEAYTGPRISDFTADQNQAMADTRNLGSTWQPQMNQAGNQLSSAGLQARAATNQGMMTSQMALANAQNQSTFGAQQAQQYMNPFIQGVIDRSRSGALQTLQEQKARANADLQNSAPFGSYSDAVSKSLLERDYGNRVADQEANLLMQGYTNAQEQFQRDRGFGLDAGRFGLDAGNFGLRGAETQGNMANQAAQMAAQRRGLAAADVDALNRSGLQQQQQRQASLDMAYNDFVNQRDYSDNRLQFMNNILRGLPSQMGSETTSYAPPANPYSQLLGLGGTAVGLANALGGRAA